MGIRADVQTTPLHRGLVIFFNLLVFFFFYAQLFEKAWVSGACYDFVFNAMKRIYVIKFNNFVIYIKHRGLNTWTDKSNTK